MRNYFAENCEGFLPGLAARDQSRPTHGNISTAKRAMKDPNAFRTAFSW
jgi:hypothetical protein